MSDATTGMIYRVGAIFLLVFFGIYIPAHTEHTLEQVSTEYQQYRRESDAKIADLEQQLNYYKASYKKIAFVQTEVDCLAQNIYYEASTEPYEGKLAVAEVTINRVKSKSFPKTVCGVVKQQSKGGVCQFSWVCEKKNAILKSYTSWKESRKIAENVLLHSKKSNIVKGATYFHADRIQPNWVAEKTYIAHVGQHVFYN